MPLAILELECLRCRYKWYPRSDKLPQRCAKCNSLHWNKPKLDKSICSSATVPFRGKLRTCKVCGLLQEIHGGGRCKKCYMRLYRQNKHAV